jgi:hypothetical protein
MKAIIQYLPNFMEVKGILPESANFETLEELLNIPWVKRWEGNTESTMPSLIFHRFSLSDAHNLMAEFNENEVWFIVGAIDNVEGLALPHWDEPVRTVNLWMRDPGYQELERACYKCSSASVIPDSNLRFCCTNRANAKVFLEIPKEILECADVLAKIQQLRNLGSWNYHYKEVSPAGVCDRFSVSDAYKPAPAGGFIPGMKMRKR